MMQKNLSEMHIAEARFMVEKPFVLLISLFICMFFSSDQAAASPVHEARVIAVNDGDTVTIRMKGNKYRARLIGIDAPEMGQEQWGIKSREHLRRILKELDWNVMVQTDIQAYDKYNRLLIYVWDADKRLINEIMLLDGYAVLFTIQPNSKYADRFKKAQRIAREKKLGIWGADGLNERPLDYKKKHPRQRSDMHIPGVGINQPFVLSLLPDILFPGSFNI